ncbi:cupin domain-containing protein [Candidatus Riflebacteria bacterium]
MKIYKTDEIKDLPKLEISPHNTDLKLLQTPDNNFPLASVYGFMDKGTEMTCIIEKNCEFLYVINGEIEISIKDKVHNLKTGDMAFVPMTGKPNDFVKYRAIVDSIAFSIEHEIN